MKMNMFFLIVSIVASAPAFAGGSSTVGPGVCRSAIHMCVSADEQTVVCVFDKGNSEKFALVDLVDVTNDSFEVAEVPSNGRVGAPIEYKGQGFDLTICGTCAEHVGRLSIPKLKIKSRELNCD